MFINKIITELQAILSNFNWFANKIILSKFSHNTLIVYVNKMNLEILNAIPSEFLGFHIVVHFIGSVEDKYAASAPKSLNVTYFNTPLAYLN